MSDNEIETLNQHIKDVTKSINDMQKRITDLLLIKRAYKQYIKFLNKK